MQTICDFMVAGFITILNMSITASVVIGFVFLARLCLKRAPKGFSYALWVVVLFRLLCPISFELPFALISLTGVSPTQETQRSMMQYISAEWTVQSNQGDDFGEAIVREGEAVVARDASNTVLVMTDGSIRSTAQGTEDIEDNTRSVSLQILIVATVIWLLGAGGLLGTNCLSLLCLKRKLRPALRYGGETYGAWTETPVYLSDAISTAFVLGGVKPCVFLPTQLSMQEQSYILRHEQVHIARYDHLWQAAAFFALCIHWFNPLVWFAFKANQKDMELSCDERVLYQTNGSIKKEYAQSLLNLSQGKKTMIHSVLAFGENDATSRIKNVLSYHKPVRWIRFIVGFALVVAAIVLVANPMTPDNSDLQVEGDANAANSSPVSSEVQGSAIQTQSDSMEGILIEETLYTELNLDGVGIADDSARVSVYRWDENGRADIITVSVQLGTGEETAYTVPSVEYAYTWGATLLTGALFRAEKDAIVLEVPVPYSNYGAADVYVLDVCGKTNGEPAVIVERMNTQESTMRLPSGLETELAELGMSGTVTDGTQIVPCEESDLQGLQLYTSGSTGDWRDTAQIVYWAEDGWMMCK